MKPKYLKFVTGNEIHSVVKIDSDNSMVEVSNFFDIPRIEAWETSADILSDYIDSDESEFRKFYEMVLSRLNEKAFGKNDNN